jgi:hypothetical protein
MIKCHSESEEMNIFEKEPKKEDYQVSLKGPVARGSGKGSERKGGEGQQTTTFDFWLFHRHCLGAWLFTRRDRLHSFGNLFFWVYLVSRSWYRLLAIDLLLGFGFYRRHSKILVKYIAVDPFGVKTLVLSFGHVTSSWIGFRFYTRLSKLLVKYTLWISLVARCLLHGFEGKCGNGLCVYWVWKIRVSKIGWCHFLH